MLQADSATVVEGPEKTNTIRDNSTTSKDKPNPKQDETPSSGETVRTAMSRKKEARACAVELAEQLIGSTDTVGFVDTVQDRNADLGWVLFFCSGQQDIGLLAQELQELLPEQSIIGCSTAGEITPIGYLQGSVCAVGFSRSGFAIETALIEEMDAFDFGSAQQLMSNMMQCCQLHQKAPVKGHTFVLALLDGMSENEEVVLNTLNAAFGSIPLLGGSAGDDLDFSHTQVVYEGQAYQNAAVLMLVNTAFPFMVFSQNHVQESDEVFVVTEVDSEHRRVYELNAEPAADVYSRAVGVSPDQLTPSLCAQHTLSVRIAGEGFVRAVQSANDDGSLSFYCAVERGIVLRKNHHLDIGEELKKLLDRIESELGDQQLILGFDCIFRLLEVNARQQLDTVSDLLSGYPLVGFHTYGEHVNGIHLNATFTGVAIGYDKR